MLYWIIFALVLLFDQVSKNWIVNNFELYHAKIIIPGFFNLVYVTNSGAAFSLFADVDSPWRHYFLAGVGVLAVLALSVIWYCNRDNNSYYSVALAFIAGGAAGNLTDRLRLGSVVDFIDVYLGSHHWPAFNVADSAICVGVVIYLILGYLEDRGVLNRVNKKNP